MKVPGFLVHRLHWDRTQKRHHIRLCYSGDRILKYAMTPYSIKAIHDFRTINHPGIMTVSSAGSWV